MGKYYFELMNPALDKGIDYGDYIDSIGDTQIVTESEYNTMTKEKQDAFWPVHDICGDSNIPVECESVEDAIDKIIASTNFNRYEYYHDL